MLKASATCKNGNPMVLLGLSRANTELLHQGKPIMVDLKDLGLPGIKICFFAGETEERMMKTLQEELGLDIGDIRDERGLYEAMKKAGVN